MKKSLLKSPKVKLRLIKKALKRGASVSEACRQIGIARVTYYRWRKRQAKPQPSSRYRKLKSFKQKERVLLERKLLRFIVAHPNLSCEELAHRFGKSQTFVWKILNKRVLGTKKLRKRWSKKTFNYPLKRQQYRQEFGIRVILLERAPKMGISRACREFGVSRTLFYKWKRRQLASEPLENKEWKVLRWGRQTPEQYERMVLNLVVRYPELSVHKLAVSLPKMAGVPIVGHHGIQNIFRRNGLNTFTKRLEYARTHAPTPALRPITAWLNRLKIVWETFVPQVAPAPPPKFTTQFRRAGPPFILSLLSTTIFSLLFVFWISMMASTPGGLRIGLFFASISLLVGTFFFVYSMKYYFTLALVLSFSTQTGSTSRGEGNGPSTLRQTQGSGLTGWLRRIFGLNGPSTLRQAQGSGLSGLQPSLEHIKLERDPFVSIHLPFYNEKNVVNRILAACTSFDYPHYEVIVCDDSTDETVQILKDWENHPKVKILHRSTREGFKGGALSYALKAMDPRTEFVLVFDADFVPYPDTLTQFLKYFKATGGWDETKDYQSGQIQTMSYDTFSKAEVSTSASSVLDHQLSAIRQKSNTACVAGYQWHVLNKSENWITRGVRVEYAGSYVIERPGQEILGALKIIHGSVYCIRADVLKHFGWGTSITEDFELTLRLYAQGFKVVYTPYIQAPSECVSTIRRLIRQRMRWSEGHSFNVKKMFWGLITNKNLSLTEKLEFLYIGPYYLQAFFFLLGTLSWLISETVFQARLPFWTSLWGWSLVLTNFFALPLMNAVGLFLEEAEEKDYLGLFSFVALSYLLVPFQAYASVKGFIEEQEGPWFRTPKTGNITDIFTRGRFYRWIAGILPGRQVATAPSYLNPYLALATAHNQFENFRINPRKIKWLGRTFLAILLLLSTTILSLAPTAPYFIKPQETQAKAFGTIVRPQGNLTQTGKSINGAYPDNSNLEELKPKEINPSTYAFKTLEGDVIEIGTEKHSPPKPYLKLSKWGGEANLKVSIPFNTTETPEQKDNKLSYSGDKVRIDFYSRGPEEISQKDSQGNERKFTINEQGGVEFDTILYEKPETNQIVFPIETQGLDFYYQPPLNEEIKDPNLTCTETTCTDKDNIVVNFRPENVVGSYAVYYKDGKSGDYSQMGGKNYKAGKAFHIYRPKVWDSSGKQVYGDLSVTLSEAKDITPGIDSSAAPQNDNNTLTITIPQSFLDSASYPVTIDPTFGYETIGGTEEAVDLTAMSVGTTRGSLFTGAAGTATKITAYTNRSTAGNAKSGIYAHSNSTLITNGETNVVSVGTSYSWVDFTFATSPTIEAVDYVLALAHVYQKFVFARYKYDAGGTDQGHSQDTSYLASPATFTHTTNKYSIYATYTSAKIDTSTSALATAYSFQRKTWYDGTRLWNAFYSGTEIEFWYSADWGATWTQNTSATISVSTNDFSIEADTADAFITYTNGYDIIANEDTGTYPATNFAWGASPTTVYDGSSATDEYDYPAVTRDSNNKVWITATHLSGTNYIFKARQSTNANDISAWQTVSTLDTSTNSNKYGVIASLGSGNMYAVWIDGTAIEGKKYGSNTLDKQVGVSADDGGRSEIAFGNTDTAYWIGNTQFGFPPFHIFARWTGVTIAGTIDVSYIQLYANAGATGSPLMKVYGVDEDNSVAPTTLEEFNADPLTTAAIDWDDAFTIDTWEQSPSLNAIFQELVDTYTISNDAVMAQVKNDGAGNNYNVARSYDYSGNVYGAKLHIEYTAWDASPTSIATGVTGLTNNMSAVSDSSGNVHLLYINSSDYAVYQEYTTSWQTAVTLDGTAGVDYPTISLNTSNNDLYALWIRSNVIYYKKGVSPYASGNWDASATSWKSTGTNAYVTSNYSGAGMIFATWTSGTASPYSVMWDYIIIPEKLWLLLGLGLVIPWWIRRRRKYGAKTNF